MKDLKNKRLIKIISGILLTAVLGVGIYSYASQQVKLEISQTPNVDVVLTKSQTSANFTEFEKKLKEELIAQKVMSQTEIDSGKIKISAIDTQTVVTQEAFEWVESVNSSIGSVSFTNNGKNVSMVGNSSLAGKNAIWIIPGGNQEQDFNFGYNINFGDSFNAAGMLLRVKKNSNNTLEGYMLSFNKSSATFYSGSSNANGALWYFKYDNDNRTAFKVGTDIRLIKSLNINPTGNLTVKVTDKAIKINGGGLSSEYIYEYKPDESYGEGYGFFSDHYSHGCDSIGSFTLTNINLKTQTVKKFTEVLQAPEWRDGALHVVINAEDKTNSQFSNTEELTAIIAKLMNNDVYYIGYGTEENRAQMEDVIKKNDNKGIYVGNSSENAIKETVEYIKKIIKPVVGNTVIAGEPVNIQVTSPSTGVETPTDAYPNGVWKVIHDEKYYENPQYQYELNGVYTNELIKGFDNVGKYYIYCEDKLITQVYAHRRPVATFNMKVVGNQVALTSNSYDLDIEANTENTEKQKATNGIKTEKWEYKKLTDSSWKKINSNSIRTEIVQELEANTRYMVRLTVTDYQDVETSAIKYVTTGASTVKPIASYKVKNKNISMYEKLEVIDESYDPSGAELTYEWTVKKENKKVYSGNQPLLDFSIKANSSYGLGNYTMSLVVSKIINGIKISSEEFSQSIQIIKDQTAPLITVNPIEAETQNQEIDILVNIKDDESGLKAYKYAFTESTDEVAIDKWSDEIAISGKSTEQTVKLSRDYTDQVLYLHIKATNQDGTVSKEKVTGPYYINPYKIELQVADSETGMGVTGATYDIIGEKENGILIEIAKNVQTDKNGKIFVEKAKLKDVSSIKIENVEKAVGYQLADYQTVKIDANGSKIIINASESSDKVQAKVSEDGQTIQIKVFVEKTAFNFEITNIDAQTKNLLSGTVFVLKQNGTQIAEGTTKDGKIVFNIQSAGVNKTKEYVLEQVSVNEQYTSCGKTYLKITFDQNGEVSKVEQKLFAENKAVTIENQTKANIIVANQRKETSKFTTQISVTDYKDGSPVKDSKYKIKVETEDGLEYTTKTYETNADGNIIIDNLYGKGLLKLTFIHEESANGYAKETVDRYITINRKDDGSIEYNKASMSGVFEKAENGVVYVKLTNVKKTSTNAIKIKISSEQNPDVALEGIGVKIYKILDNSLIGTGVTDENGNIELINIQNDGNGEVIYRLEIENDVLGITPIIVIKYENNKIVDTYQMSKLENINVFYSEDDDTDMFKYVSNIQIKGTMNPINGDTKLIITQKDKDSESAVIGAQYKIKMSTSNSIITKIISTGDNGQANTELLNDKNITIQITQTKAANGYLIDDKTKTILLTKNNKGIYQVNSTNNINASQIKIDENGNVLVEDNVYSNKNSRVKFQVAKTDTNKKLSLGGFKFRVTEETTGYSQEITTSSNGYVEIGEEFVAKEGKSYIFKLEELQTVEPYKLLGETINVEVRFTKEGEIVTYKGISYLQGKELLSDRLVSYEAEKNQVNISLKIMNSTEDILSGILYDIDIIKVNSKGEKIPGSRYDVEIRPYAESSIISANTLVNDEIEVSDLAIRQDKTTILLKEVKAAVGYGLDEEIKVVTLKIDENGNLVYLQDTTTKELKVEIINKTVDGVTKKVVTITVPTKVASETEQPDVPNVPDIPNDTDKEKPAEERPKNATVAVKIFNKSYGNWTRSYSYRWSSYWYWHWYRWETHYYQLENAQKLERIFKDNSDSQSHGFKFITGSEITLETRLVEDGVISKEIYETSNSRGNTNINDTNGTDSIYLYKNYKNKTVEITVIQNVPSYNYKRDTTDIKFIAKFDANGKMKSAEITQGNDTEEFAIGGISAQGIVDNIKYLSYVERNGSTEYSIGEIKKYNSLGTDTINIGLLNKALSNPLEITVNLKDIDSNYDLNGEASIIVSEKRGEEYIPLGYQTATITNGVGKARLDNTYANRTLRIELAQISNGRRENLTYKNEAKITTQFDVTFDDDANVKKLEQVTISDNVEYVGSSNNRVEYTIYNSIIYNFAINVKKVDENGKPLKDVRIQTEAYYISNITTGNGNKVFAYGSQKTDENGNTKLKVSLPETGSYKYYGKTIDIVLKEYYVPDNYRAIELIKIRILFSTSGTVTDCQIISDYEEGNTVITGKNNVEKGTTEISSIDIKMKNKQVEAKPILQITNTDSENNTIKLGGTKYKITVWDEEEYAVNNLAINEIRYSQATDKNGLSKIYFENAHALRTMIYKIEEVESSKSYIANKDILIRVIYDKDGKIISKPQILTEQNIYVPNKGAISTVSIEGDPIGDTLLKLNIINELEPYFKIKINKSELQGYKTYNKNIFKAVSQVKNEDGTYQVIEEERLSKEMYMNSTEVGFKTEHRNQTVLYTISEQTGNTYTERGKVEIVFDEYGNVKNQVTTGHYITRTNFSQNQNYINTYIRVEDFRMKVRVESVNKEVDYSLAGYTFDITNSKGEHSNVTTKTNNIGDVIELVGEVYKGESINYHIEQVTNAIDYEPTKEIDLTVVFDENGKITSCTPNSKEGVFDLITTVKDTDTNINMEIKMYVIPSKRTQINIDLQDDADKTKIIQSALYDITVNNDKNSRYPLMISDGNGQADVGSCQKYKNQTITYTLKQSAIEEKYMINTSDIQISVTYDNKGLITDARIIASDGYVQIDDTASIGTTTLKLITKNRVKARMQVYNINQEDTTSAIAGSNFKIIQKGKEEVYGDTKVTSLDGRAQLYVGPYYISKKITYQITNPKPGFGFKEIQNTEFTLTYNEKGKIIASEIPTSAQNYLTIEIPNKNSEYYNQTEIIITIKSKPLLTIGVESVDKETNKPLAGGKYQIRQVNKTTNAGTVITKTEELAHASVGETIAGQTTVYEIIELQAPLGYKYKSMNKVIGTLQIGCDGEGKIITQNSVLLSGFEYISIKQGTDKPNSFDIDIQIKYEEIDEFKVIIENQNILDNTEKIKSNFHGQLTTGVYKDTTTDKDTGLGMLNFGKILAINSKQTLIISQSQIEGSYMAIANIRLDINFDENGKIKSISPFSNKNYATHGEAYVIEQTGAYTVKITVKNNPVTKFNIKNVSDGDDTLTVDSTYELTGSGINGKINLVTKDGEASSILESVPKSINVDYVLKQTEVARGYTLNKNIVIRVTYNNDGKITNAYQIVSASTADRTVIKSITYDSYQLNIEIKNKQKFEFYISTQDAFDGNIKLANMQIYLKEVNYSKQSVTVKTDSKGQANTILGSTIANSYLDYEVTVLTTQSGYNTAIQKGKHSIRVYFGSNGNITNCVSNSEYIDVKYGSGLAVEVNVKYIPNLEMQIERTNTSTKTPLTGRELTISSPALEKTIKTTTNAQGKLNINAGKIKAENTITYNISEQNVNTDTNIEKLPNIIVNVTYDNLGRISRIATNQSEYVVASGIGTRSIVLEIGTKKITTMSIITSDYHNHTVNITGKYEITSNKGEKTTISSSTGLTNTITNLGKVYPGEKITYVIHPVSIQRGYEIVEDQKFEVKYSLDGTINSVNPLNKDRLVVKKTQQNNSQTEPNIMLQLYSKSTLEIAIKVIDKNYNSGVYGLGFKIKNELTGIETTVDSKTNENGILKISVPPTYENRIVNYTITQTNSYGGYKAIKPIRLVVSYGNLGTVKEKGTYIINPQNEKITQGYSEELYKSSRLKGVQIEIKGESQLGVGIEKIDVYGNKLSGVEYIITAKEENNTNNWRAMTNTKGETTKYLGDIPKNKTIEYTISELQAPTGYRKMEDAIIKVCYNSEGRITSYTIEQQPENATIELATDKLCTMSDSKESVHLKLKITNDNRVTFRVVNQDVWTEKPIANSEFSLSVENIDGTIKADTIKTNAKGQAIIENINANGDLTFYFSQNSIPENYKVNNQNSGYIKINKSSKEYKLTYLSSTDNLNYTIDNETGIVTIYLKNENNLLLNIADIDGETGKTVENGSHMVKAQYGELNETVTSILTKNDNILLQKGPENSSNAITSFDLGNTYKLFNKKVVYTISTPTTPDNIDGKYNAIKDQYIVVEFDGNGLISKINGETSRIENVSNSNSLTMNVIIAFGNIDNYKIKIIKQAETSSQRVNGSIFNVNLNVNGTNVETYEALQTGPKLVNEKVVEEGVAEIKKLQYEGKVKLTLTEIKAPEGHEGLINIPINIEFDVKLDKTDINDVKLIVRNEKCNSQSATIQVNDKTREIAITVSNKPIIKLEIDKVDENNNSLSGISFNMKVQEKNNLSNIIDYGTITTTQAGTIQTAIENKYYAKSIFIILTEEKNEYYQQIAPITIEAEIDENGEIISTKLISGKNNANITYNKTNIKAKITNKLEEYAKPYEIKVVKTNENDSNIRIAGVPFQVKVTPDVGIPVYQAATTDENGEINLKGLVGSGNIVIEIREIVPPAGYELGKTDGYYKYGIKKENDVLQKVYANVEEDLLNIDNANKSINIKVPNRTDLIGLAINKVDENDYDLNIVNTKFKLIDISSGNEYTSTTDNKGIAYFALPKSFNETKKYKLTEILASGGYQLDNNPREISLYYDSEGKITKASETNGLELMDKNNNYVKYSFANKQKELNVLPYTIKVINVNKNNNQAVIKDSEFSIKVNQTVGATSLETTKTTNENGEIALKVNGAGDIKIDLQNTKVGLGYQINNNKMFVKMNRNQITGNITIKESENVITKYDEANRTVIIYVQSESAVNQYTMQINLVDKITNKLIADKNVKLNITLNGETKQITSNETGKIILQGLQIPDLAKFEINIEETQEPNGYETVALVQKIIAHVTEIYNSRALYNVEITQGQNIQIVNASDNELTINLLHQPLESSDDELYLKSDIYRVTEKYVERISGPRTVKDYLANMKSNGEMKVYDNKGNIVADNNYVGTGMKIVATKGTESITKTLSVIGDVTGNGLIKALDISLMKQHLVGKKKLEGAYLLAGDINDDGVIKALDISKEKQAIVGKITL